MADTDYIVKARNSGSSSGNSSKNWDRYFLRCIRYETLIYAVALIEAASQLTLMGFNIYYLTDGLDIYDKDPELMDKGIIFSWVVIVCLFASAVSELYLMRAVSMHFLRYIQWWMMCTLSIVIVAILLCIVTGFMFKDWERALWIPGGFFCLMVELPVQMYFVDKFAHANIFLDLQPHI